MDALAAALPRAAPPTRLQRAAAQRTHARASRTLPPPPPQQAAEPSLRSARRARLATPLRAAPDGEAVPWRSTSGAEASPSAFVGATPSPSVSGAAATSTAAAPKQRLSARQLVERAARVLDDIIREFNTQAFLEDGAAEMSGTAADVAHPAVLRAAVAAQLEHLDEHFLAALNGYINAASVRENRPLLRLLMAIREETLAAVSQRLPAALRVVDLLSATPTPELRKELLVLAATGGGEWRAAGGVEVPAAGARDVENAAARLVEQMEDRDEVVADAQLLVRCTLAREATRDALAQRQAASGAAPVAVAPEKVITGAFPPSALPKYEAALLKELVTVGDATLRRGLLAVALEDALALGNNPDPSSQRGGVTPRRPASAAGRWGAAPPGPPRNPKPGAPEDASAPPPVRPGRFLDCIANLQADIATAEGARTAAELQSDAIWRRLADIRADTLAILEDMAGWR